MASTKQFDYALALLNTLGYATGRINGCHVHLGAPTGGPGHGHDPRGALAPLIAASAGIATVPP